jgi:cell wall-associated NlpC family hydrolase
VPDRILVPLSVVTAAVGAVLMVVAAAAPVTTAAPAAPTTTTATRTSWTTTTTTTTTAITTTPAPTAASTTTATEPAATTTAAPEPPPPEPSPVERVLAYARAQIGRPYRKGAAGPDAFDCSGLVRAAFLTIGVDVPHYSVTQAQQGSAVDWRREPIRPGDLVFTRGDTPVIDLGHVGIAVSATEWIVASRPGQPVGIGPLPVRSIQRVRRMVDG